MNTENNKESLMDILSHHLSDSGSLYEPFGSNLLFVTKHVYIIWIVMFILSLFVLYSFYSIKKSGNHINNRFALLLLIFVDFIKNNIVKDAFGKNSNKWLPFFLTLFLFIALCNLIGLVPYSSTVTGNITATTALACITFVVTQVYGMKKHGILQYWKNLVPSGIPTILAPFMFLIEFIGLFTKPFALLMRLFANMVAGHIIILVLLYLIVQTAGNISQIFVAPIAILGVLFVNLLEIFVSLLQAYIFTFLSAIFVSQVEQQH